MIPPQPSRYRKSDSEDAFVGNDFQRDAQSLRLRFKSVKEAKCLLPLALFSYT
jgi:hypothetical protein